MDRRRAGIILHPISLPGREDIGTLGREARNFLAFLHHSGQTLWQILPLGPTGFGDSPYQCFSAFAGNPLMIDLAELPGLPPESEDQGDARPGPTEIDYGTLIPKKFDALGTAADRFLSTADAAVRSRFEEFRTQQAYWLEDFALFMALKGHHGGRPWTEWAPDLVKREPSAMQRARTELKSQIRSIEVQQFFFEEQWSALKTEANRLGIQIIGDMPIFVAFDSADVWANPELFHLDAKGHPTMVAGVPPDYFSTTGQLWGNPLYRWERMEQAGFPWWTARFKRAFELTDIVRIDHFRGFESYWSVPAGAPTAESGKWLPGPGSALFEVVQERLGPQSIIAEDLGVITPEVDQLRIGQGYPGMTVLQFAFDGEATNRYLPHNHEPMTVVYTGTHDNDTTQGWFDSLPEHQKHNVRRYLGHALMDPPWDLMRVAQQSVARYAIVPMQDVLRRGAESRMNRPGQAGGNWSWRFTWEQVYFGLQDELLELTRTYGRA